MPVLVARPEAAVREETSVVVTKAIPPEPFVLVQGGPQFDEAELPSLRGRAAKLFPGLAKWPVEKWLVAPAIIFIAASLIYRIAFDLTIDLVAK